MQFCIYFCSPKDPYMSLNIMCVYTCMFIVHGMLVCMHVCMCVHICVCKYACKYAQMPVLCMLCMCACRPVCVGGYVSKK